MTTSEKSLGDRTMELKEILKKYGLEYRTDKKEQEVINKKSFHYLNFEKLRDMEEEYPERFQKKMKVMTNSLMEAAFGFGFGQTRIYGEYAYLRIVDKEKFLAKSATRSPRIKKFPSEMLKNICFSIEEKGIIKVRFNKEEFFRVIFESEDPEVLAYKKEILGELTERDRLKILFSKKEEEKQIRTGVRDSIEKTIHTIQVGKAFKDLRKELREYFEAEIRNSLAGKPW